MINQQLLVTLLALREKARERDQCLSPNRQQTMCDSRYTAMSFSAIECRNCPLSTRTHTAHDHYIDITKELLRSLIDE